MKILAVEYELAMQTTKLNVQCHLNFVNNETKEVSIENAQKNKEKTSNKGFLSMRFLSTKAPIYTMSFPIHPYDKV